MTKTQPTRHRMLAAVLPLMLAACASPPAVTWPAALAPADSEAWLMTAAARGVQIYECRAGASGNAWAFVAPEAQLFDAASHPIGKHGAGPAWQALDGSWVEGKLVARADAPVADAIPWLLLSTRDAGPAGRFSRVTHIRRINTVGGVAPRSGCNADSLGATARVPYTADYLLYTTR
ncbi:MAG TPA: DUF3455 domain-containing protein [Albitalea sp.]|nr:DUF3455 domain-containing protein [Albitalea sp.]